MDNLEQCHIGGFQAKWYLSYAPKHKPCHLIDDHNLTFFQINIQCGKVTTEFTRATGCKWPQLGHFWLLFLAYHLSLMVTLGHLFLGLVPEEFIIHKGIAIHSF